MATHSSTQLPLQFNFFSGGITSSMDMSLSKFQEIVKDMETWHAVVHGVTKSWTRLNN